MSGVLESKGGDAVGEARNPGCCSAGPLPIASRGSLRKSVPQAASWLQVTAAEEYGLRVGGQEAFHVKMNVDCRRSNANGVFSLPHVSHTCPTDVPDFFF